MTEPDEQSAEIDAGKRAAYLTGLLWHGGTFVIINVFLWVLNGATTGDITWAFWVTVFWGLALAFHVLAYLIDGRQLQARKARKYLREQQGSDERAD